MSNTDTVPNAPHSPLAKIPFSFSKVGDIISSQYFMNLTFCLNPSILRYPFFSSFSSCCSIFTVSHRLSVLSHSQCNPLPFFSISKPSFSFFNIFCSSLQSLSFFLSDLTILLLITFLCRVFRAFLRLHILL